MKLWKKAKAVSPLVAVVILLVIALIAGATVYYLFSQRATTQTRILITLSQLATYCDGEGHAAISITVKNTGSIPITKVEVSVGNDTTFEINQRIEPGETASRTINFLSNIRPGEYVQVTLFAIGSDGSTYSDVTTSLISYISHLDPTQSILMAADRLVALQGIDYGWDWIVTNMTEHSDNPSGTNLYGVTELGLIEAYYVDERYFDAAKQVADFITYGDPSAGDFYNGFYGDMGYGPSTYWWAYSFDFKFLVRFSEISGNSSYRDYAVEAWQWDTENLERYEHGNQEVMYQYLVNHAGHGFAGWQAADYGVVAYMCGDELWANQMAEVLIAHLDDIINAEEYSNLGLGQTLRLLALLDNEAYAGTINQITTILKDRQNTAGYWSDNNPEGDAQTTAYVIMGLQEVGEADSARRGINWLIATQMANGGWLAGEEEYSETDSEVLRALATVIGG